MEELHKYLWCILCLVPGTTTAQHHPSECSTPKGAKLVFNHTSEEKRDSPHKDDT